MSAEIRELSSFEEMAALAELFAVVWGRPSDPPIGSDVLKALAQSHNYVAGAFDGGRLIGGLVGWFGGEPPHELHLHSHILGVLPGSDARGLGFELKQHQRRWCLERDVKVIEWTTDPLVRRNAYFNLSKLGARAPEYLVNVYGAMRDGINAGEESDRLLIRWQLDSEEAKAAAAGHPRELEATGDTVLHVGTAGEPVVESSRANVLICQIPDEIVQLRRAHPAIAREWRMTLRRVLRDALDDGYVIDGATRSGWYVLRSQRH
jgi:predicted GNAT superfamily acetyltransferase